LGENATTIVNDTSVGKRVKWTQRIGKLYPPRMMKSGVNGEKLEEKTSDVRKMQATGEWRERQLHQNGKNLKLRKIDESGMRKEGQHGVVKPSVRLTKGRISGDERLKKMKRRFVVIGRGEIVNMRGKLSRKTSELGMKSGGNDAKNELNVNLQDELPKRNLVLRETL
jgi:hypothetical protein